MKPYELRAQIRDRAERLLWESAPIPCTWTHQPGTALVAHPHEHEMNSSADHSGWIWLEARRENLVLLIQVGTIVAGQEWWLSDDFTWTIEI